MAEKVYLTVEGAEELQRELDDLVRVKRPELAVKLAEAVSMGDLKENADYHDTKEKQAFVEMRITYLENVLRSAEVVANQGNGIIQVGSHVTIVEDGYTDEESFTIVGAAEANPNESKISNESPIGAALLGHKKGDKVVAKTPGGELVFKVKKVE